MAEKERQRKEAGKTKKRLKTRKEQNIKSCRMSGPGKAGQFVCLGLGC